MLARPYPAACFPMFSCFLEVLYGCALEHGVQQCVPCHRSWHQKLQHWFSSNRASVVAVRRGGVALMCEAFQKPTVPLCAPPLGSMSAMRDCDIHHDTSSFLITRADRVICIAPDQPASTAPRPPEDHPHTISLRQVRH